MRLFRKHSHDRTEQEGFQVCKVDMTAEAAEDEGMVCGGVVEVMLERVK